MRRSSKCCGIAANLWPRLVVGLVVVVVGCGACAFTPPPPLPEELAAKQAEDKARTAAVGGGTPTDPAGSGPGETDGAAEAYSEGDPPDLGMTAEQMRAYAEAQGDPAKGSFTLAEALGGLPEEGELWAKFELTDGALECQLHEDQTPTTVANFVGLARGLRPARDPGTGAWETRPYYDGSVFHRVIEGFMIQGGDPTGTGRGNTGYVILDEFRPELRHDAAGMLSMANRGPGTGSAQFFITLAPTPHLDDKHTIFGTCTEASVKLAERIAATGDAEDRPNPPQTIERVVIERR